MNIELAPYWSKVVSYYYDNNIQDRPCTYTTYTSIWDWLREDYGAKCNAGAATARQSYLTFNNEVDATAFTIKFGPGQHGW